MADPAVCYQLYRVLDKHDTHSFSPTGRALAVLAHESWHLHGVSSEALANCYGFQSGVTSASGSACPRPTLAR